jgi:type II secretory pathway component PulK
MRRPTTIRPHGEPHGERRKGVVLLAVMISIAILSLAAYQYADLTTAEYKASVSAIKAAQAKAAADAGIHYALALLASPDNLATINNNLLSNPDAFSNVPAGIEGATFSFVAPTDPNDPGSTGLIRYGFIDEGAKLNIGMMLAQDKTGDSLYNGLLKLPNMENAIAGAIVDYFDADDTPRVDGAESEYYSSLSPPYRAKNAPPTSIEELLLVKGVTKELLFGGDLSRTGFVDPNSDTGNGLTDLGWSQFLTAHSRELNVNSKGTKLKDINATADGTYYDQIASNVDEDLAKYMMLYRKYGPQQQTSTFAVLATGLSLLTGKSNQTTTSSGAMSVTLTTKSSSNSNTKTVNGSLSSLSKEDVLNATKSSTSSSGTGGSGNSGSSGKGSQIKSIFALVNTTVAVPNNDPKNPITTIYTSPLNDPDKQKTLLPKLFDLMSTSKEDEIAARINVNTASKEVLTTLTGIVPELTDTDVQNILSSRPSPSAGQSSDTTFTSIGWLLSEAKIAPATLQKLEKFVTARSQVYRVQVIGRIANGPSARVEAVIDVNAGRPRVLYYRDLTEAGTPNMPQ